MSESKAVVPLMAAAAALPLVVITMLLGAVSGASASTAGTTCTVIAPAGDPATASVPGLQISSEQMANAVTLVGVAKTLGMPVQAAAIAIMTSQQESGLLNLDHGDRDSLGLFQQRPSQGWGTPTQILDPTYASTAFYTRLAQLPGWAELPMAQAAQQVQASGDGSLYQPWAGFGTAVAGALWSSAPGQLVCAQPQAYEGPPGASRSAGAVLAFAQAQLGKPYVYGATGPDAFDCSGLTLRAYEAAGIGLPRTSEEQWSAGPHVAQDQLQPGDLVSFDPDASALPGHVGIYAGNGTMIDAPNSEGVVRVENIAGFGTYLGAVRPTNGHSATTS